MTKRILFLALATASLAVSACDSDQASNTTVPSGPIEPIPAPNNGDWSTVVSETAEGGFLMGNPQAPVKLVEFGSMTCPHCAEFDEAAMQPLVDTYVKSGRVSFEFRNFVRDPYDLAASLVARCGGPSSFFGLTRGLFSDQREWLTNVQQADPARMQRIGSLPPQQQLPEIAEIAGFQQWAAMRGLPPEKTAQCLTNQAEIDKLVQMNSDAATAFNIPGTPAFLINGEMVEIQPGTPVWTQIEAALRKALG